MRFASRYVHRHLLLEIAVSTALRAIINNSVTIDIKFSSNVQRKDCLHCTHTFFVHLLGKLTRVAEKEIKGAAYSLCPMTMTDGSIKLLAGINSTVSQGWDSAHFTHPIQPCDWF